MSFTIVKRTEVPNYDVVQEKTEELSLNAGERKTIDFATADKVGDYLLMYEFKGADGAAYRSKAYEAGWAGVLKQSPEHGAKLKGFFAKSN